jgi:hypothetical protein
MVTKAKSMSDLINDLVKTADELLTAANILMVLEGDDTKARPKSILERILEILEPTIPFSGPSITFPPSSGTWTIPNNKTITTDHTWGTSISSGATTDMPSTWHDADTITIWGGNVDITSFGLDGMGFGKNHSAGKKSKKAK